MKSPFLPVLCSVLAVATLRLMAQTADDVTAEPPPPQGATVITSNECHVDQLNHVTIFSGKVIVTGTNFRMTCHEMTVNFTKDNKVDNIVATGDVVITQPDRITTCGRADYFRDEDKFVLTDQPVIVDGKNRTSGPLKIIIYRGSKKMETEGGRTTLILGPGAMGTSKDAAPGTETK